MSPRSLFNIILKVMGIYFLKEVLILFPQLLSVVLYLHESRSEAIWIFFTTIIMIVIYGFVIVNLVLKTDTIIDKFELDKGFEEENFSINIHRSTVLYLIIVLSGLITIITILPFFCRAIFDYFEQKRLTYGGATQNISNIIFYSAQILIGFLLLGNARLITNFIELRKTKRTSHDVEHPG